MGKATASPVVDQARLLLTTFRNSSESEIVHHADDVLTYFQSLRENYSILRSTSPRFSGNTFNILEEVIYQLESDPDATLHNEGFREFILLVLEDIASNRIQVVARPAV